MDIGSLLGDVAKHVTPQMPVTDISQHMDGGNTPTGKLPSTAEAIGTLYGGASVVLVSVGLLWFLGGIAFRGLPHI